MDHTDKSNDYCRNFHYATVQKQYAPSINGQGISAVVLLLCRKSILMAQR